ncbi:transposase [Rhodococcus opacus]|uniref:transposase n=1 Tax=Rhodococcus opacus TaxID=37919 RepID=UPI0029537578|nr:transposase [Rhodococcus opacus]MDV7088439.1 transposase [Rhodococcus opacus]
MFDPNRLCMGRHDDVHASSSACYLGVSARVLWLSRDDAGRDASALARVGEQLDTFVGEVFSSLARKNQWATAGVYVWGFMVDGRRKSMQTMAQRLRVDHQRLQQFVTTSQWDVVPVRKTLSRRACDLITPHVWVIDDTRFAKDGDRSGNTRAPSARSATSRSRSACTPPPMLPRHRFDWRLFLAENWVDRSTTDPEVGAAIIVRRKRSAVPGAEHHRPT